MTIQEQLNYAFTAGMSVRVLSDRYECLGAILDMNETKVEIEDLLGGCDELLEISEITEVVPIW